MPFHAGFAEVDISPVTFPVRTYLGKQESIDDPIFAHAAVFRTGDEVAAVVSIDVVIVEWEYVERIRRLVTKGCGIPGERLLVCATHNHACPAVVERPGHSKENEYLDHLVAQTARAVVEAHASLAPAQIAVDRTLESRVSFNRRFIKRDGTVVTQPRISEIGHEILCNEGVIDPDLGVLCVQSDEGAPLGVLVNFACHACHSMGRVSSGYPGVMTRQIKESLGADCSVLFLNGACANLMHSNYLDPTADTSMERTGSLLAEGVLGLVAKMDTFDAAPALRMAEGTQKIGFRDWSILEAAVENRERFVNVFEFLIDRGWYSHSLDVLRGWREQTDHFVATQQALRIGPAVFATAPAEYFTENGLRIKELSPHSLTFVVSLANGWLGYIPHPEAFERAGGHETFPGLWSKMEIEAGRMLGDKALDLIREIWP
ncbi:MAG: hypothetical protein HN742_36820 [Lentisphaerae bacterium]|jgi:neutral ceramidase|nr:hypothetical protein [Lentisphaerota bacterium]MBT4814720.1 hypothetical protein [Lentisphaerota bacterium]MBT5605802.1 hypothetical protein [Lentisphaerota bacterium]MBT7055825.1 hypothetical protein [Lentisphaerota bacterium]MBT7847490.1 hypothetical protein [Lentisphaerota bacterium]